MHHLRESDYRAMTPDIRDELKKELSSRGFRRGVAPNGSMSLDDEYLAAIEVGELLDQLVARREKIFGSGGVVGLDIAKKNYDDIVAAVDALKRVIDRLVIPPAR